ncbi:metallophosphoesterase [Halomonas huangheensis]|uniref:Calcineurin-like phosphoesterase domain-containing protein n=1 Tax=Halomonas huangheensis TaxID=1178482 RepID=W1N3S9_9GAMM|nr:metallophosphoesterase [Halomonas huangheensis]ALM51727.1 metallophosphoesterase [Halomonas huangheensis]ERL50222.1 hypothetical protein BJB45_03590 [Halomonas huangheensis]
MRLIQLSDCHLYADPQARSRCGNPARQLAAVVAAADALRPDLVLVTGDISQDETQGAYHLAADALARLDCPWYWIPGNHDDPELMNAVQEVVTEVASRHWRILQLDTHIEGDVRGEVGEQQLARLQQQLAEDDRPTLIAMHHPPVEVGSTWMDAISLGDQQAFWAVLDNAPQVRMVICGHVHHAFQARVDTTQGHVEVYACPSTSDQFLAGSDEFAVDEASRPGLRVIDLQRDSWQTWVERVDV